MLYDSRVPSLTDDQLREIYQNCKPYDPLEPDDARNTDIDAEESVRGGRWIDEYERELRWGDRGRDGNYKTHLFSGLIGSGKSTELRRLALRLRQHGLVVALIDADDHVDLNAKLHCGDLLLAMLYGAEWELCGRPEGAATLPVCEATWRWILELDTGLPADRLPRDGDGLARRVVGELKFNTPARKHLRRAFDENSAAFLARVRESFRTLDELAEARGGGLVAIVDSLEHLSSLEDWHDAMLAAQVIFSGSSLELPVRTLYTAPPSVLLREKENASRFFPMVKLHTAFAARDVRHEPGFKVLREFVRRRVPEDKLRALFGEDFPSRVDEMISCSGGYPRMLVQMLQKVVLCAKAGRDPAVLPGDFSRQLTQLQQPMIQAVRFEGPRAIELLRMVDATHELKCEDEGQQVVAARLLSGNAILMYKNSVWWWDLHPWIRDMKELHN